ncbi:MAG: DUF1667 domain-containing protein [Clostridia bacterium]|nr:DUF1667 domain-containing protein [Clostridia bacterium]
MKELICIVCPKGCRLKVDEENGFKVTGNSCPRGAEYGKNEISDPRRTVTSTVRISGSHLKRCPVRTSSPIPKNMMFELMDALNSVELHSPVKRGEVVIENVLGTGSDVIVTRDM